MGNLIRSAAEKIRLKLEAGKLFSPRVPISQADLFSGRAVQVMKIVQAMNQPGAHAIIYGERGVGKTSLATIAPLSFGLSTEQKPVISPRVNCDSTDTYQSLWEKVFGKIAITEERTPMGLVNDPDHDKKTILETLGGAELSPGIVQVTLAECGKSCHLVIVLDEFDQLPKKGDVQQLIANTIKALSDHQSQATLVVVGVGDSIGQLVRGHQSVGRHLVEVALPRMSKTELEKVVQDRLPPLELSIDTAALHLISLLSSGLPYYTHLLGQHAACTAIDLDSDTISQEHAGQAMKNAIDDSEREMKTAYYNATKSRHPDASFARTLAACALATHDEFGYFTATDVRTKLSLLQKKEVTIADFTKHIEKFTSKEVGEILQSTGEKPQRRYRFHDPLMQPFVVIKSLETKVFTIGDLNKQESP